MDALINAINKLDADVLVFEYACCGGRVVYESTVPAFLRLPMRRRAQVASRVADTAHDSQSPECLVRDQNPSL